MGDVVAQGLFLVCHVKFNMVINELIRSLMMKNKRTIIDVANATGYTVERIKQIVLFDSSPTTTEAKVIFEAFGISLSEIICY